MSNSPCEYRNLQIFNVNTEIDKVFVKVYLLNWCCLFSRHLRAFVDLFICIDFI